MRNYTAAMGLLAALLAAEDAAAQLPELTDGYLCTGHCEPGVSCLTIAQNGVELIITNHNGEQIPGRFLSNSTIQTNEWNVASNKVLIGIISKDLNKVEWDNNTIWIRTDLCPDPQE